MQDPRTPRDRADTSEDTSISADISAPRVQYWNSQFGTIYRNGPRTCAHNSRRRHGLRSRGIPKPTHAYSSRTMYMNISPTTIISQIKAKNQLRVNGLSFSMYFLSYFVVLIGLMTFICICILGIIFLFDVPSLQEIPALVTLSGLVMLYCPSSILFSTCLAYMFDKMDSAQSFLPNIATFFGLIPFCLVMILDMLGVGKRYFLKKYRLKN